jgi:glycosidase
MIPDSLWHWHRRLIQLRHDHASLRRGKARFLETDAGPGVLAFWREADADRTLTILGASPSVTVKLPSEVAGRPDAWVLGEGPIPLREGRNLRIGPLVPFASMVLRWGG